MKRCRRQVRPGSAAVIAMVMLVIGTALATGFAAILRSAQDIAGNHQAIVDAKLAAESGMDFLIYKLIKVAPNANMRTRISANWIAPLAGALQSELDSTANLGSGRVLLSTDGLRISVPTIAVDETTTFSATITPSDTPTDDGLTLRVTGTSRQGAVQRTLAINLNCDPERLLSALRFAIAAKGGIHFTSNAAEILGYDPVTNLPDGRTGEVMDIGTDTANTTQVIVLLKSGESKPDYGDVVRLTFPDTNASFVSGLPELRLWDGSSALTNVTIPPTTGNQVRTFKDQVINGIMYVKWPNNIRFEGNTKLNGVIIYETPTNSAGSSIVIDKDCRFINDRSNTVDQLGLIPSLSDAQRKLLSSWAIIAPNTDLTYANGDIASAVKYFENSIHVKSVTGEGQGSGNVSAASLTMNQASVITEGPVRIGGNRILWMRPAEDGGPDGSDYIVRSLYVMQTTYREPQ